MPDANSIKIGQTVLVTFPWREDELPTDENFFTGCVEEIIEKAVYAVYVRVEGLKTPVPIDRVCAVKNTNEETKQKAVAL